MSAPRSYYSVLGVRPDASPTAIRDAYRSMARRLHPDSSSGEGSEQAMRELNEAWRVLGDPSKRAHYDQRGRDSGAGARPSTVVHKQPKKRWRPLDHSFEPGSDSLGVDHDLDDDDPGSPLDPRSAGTLRILTLGAVGAAVAAVALFGLSVLLDAGQFIALGGIALAVSIMGFTMAPLYAMSRSRRRN